MRIYTIGHSTRTIEDFIKILKTYDIEQLVDVRTIAKSRHNPQFGEQELDKSLNDVKIKYIRLERLGGLRKTTESSPNKAWQNKSFRGYADYMQTIEFAKGIEELLSLGVDGNTAIMCAEAVPWRCHRSLIGDALLVRDVDVEDIMNEKNTKPHTMTSFAHVTGIVVTYPEVS